MIFDGGQDEQDFQDGSGGRSSVQYPVRLAILSQNPGLGDAMVDYAYCLQHGAGVRRDLAQAEEIYRRAIESDHVTEAGREEAQYLLSVILLRNKSDSSRREAVKLLEAATADGDHPVAQRFLEDVASGREGAACTCRRYLRPGLARRHCPLHRPTTGSG